MRSALGLALLALLIARPAVAQALADPDDLPPLDLSEGPAPPPAIQRLLASEEALEADTLTADPTTTPADPTTTPAPPLDPALALDPTQAAHGAATFEERHLIEACAALHLQATTPSPDEPLAFVELVGFPVFRPGELIPAFLNVFHWDTIRPVIRRELLLAPGRPYDAERALESARNLRRLGLFQFVRVDPVRDAEGRLGLLIVTRDLWSLRLEQAFQYTGGQFDALTLQLTELNAFGRNKQATARFNLDPVTYVLGGRYNDPRVNLGATRLEVSGDAFFRRADHTFDGLAGRLIFERPFYNLGQRWGFGVQVDALDRTRRQVQAGEILAFEDPAQPEGVARRAFAQRVVAVGAGLRHQTRAFGHVHRLAVGAGFFHRGARVVDETNLGATDAAAFLAAVAPRDLTQAGPRIAWRMFSDRFRTFQDLRSYGVSEDARIGPELQLALDAPLAALGSTATALRVDAGAAYTLDYAETGLIDGLVAAEGRLEGGQLIDRALLLRGRVASPRTPAGRLLLRADWLVRAQDTANTFVSLGGDNGLRGHTSQAFFGFGAHRLRGNLEYRAPPWAWSWLHLGLAAFYDVGDVYDRAADLTLRQAVGVGARILFPQFNREVFRLDLGVPVGGGRGFVVNLSAGSSQAVPMSPEEDRGALGMVGGFENQL